MRWIFLTPNFEFIKAYNDGFTLHSWVIIELYLKVWWLITSIWMDFQEIINYYFQASAVHNIALQSIIGFFNALITASELQVISVVRLIVTVYKRGPRFYWICFKYLKIMQILFLENCFHGDAYKGFSNDHRPIPDRSYSSPPPPPPLGLGSFGNMCSKIKIISNK